MRPVLCVTATLTWYIGLATKSSMKGLIMANKQVNPSTVSVSPEMLSRLYDAFLSKGQLVTSVAVILNELGVKERADAKEVASRFVKEYPLFSSVTGETLYRYQASYNYWLASGLSLEAFEYLVSERAGVLYNLMLANKDSKNSINVTAKTLERYAKESSAEKLDNLLPKRKGVSTKTTFSVSSDKVRFMHELKDLAGTQSFEDAAVWASQTLQSQAELLANKQAQILSLEAEVEALKAELAKRVKADMQGKGKRQTKERVASA